MLSRSVFLAPLLGVVLSQSVLAQDNTTRNGIWGSIELGYGSLHLSCDSCRSDPHVPGLDALIALGATKNPHLRVGIVLDIWGSFHEQGIFSSTITGSLSFLYYPLVRRGLFLEAGVGVSGIRREGGGTVAKGVGWGTSAGLGYDIRYKRTVFFKPRIAYTRAGYGKLYNTAGFGVGGWKMNMLSLDFGLNYEIGPQD